MNFSLIVPSRQRVDLLDQFITSVEKTVLDPSNIEIMVVADTDDYPTIQYLRKKECSMLRPFIRNPGNSISVDYQNWVFERSYGKYLFVLNDDVELMTNYWDKIVLDKFKANAKHDGILYGWVSDVENCKKDVIKDYSAFPIISRRGAEVLGFLMPPYYSGWTADICIHEIYSKVGRVIDLKEVVALHKSHWVGKREKDDLFPRMQQKSHDASNQHDVSADVSKLKLEIAKKNKVMVF
jgi:glycosyltransferase involved in cell wall biosynthesis